MCIRDSGYRQPRSPGNLVSRAPQHGRDLRALIVVEVVTVDYLGPRPAWLEVKGLYDFCDRPRSGEGIYPEASTR